MKKKCSRFLSNWLDCEERAETSHNIGSELLCCARLARKNDHDLFARFVSGFYKDEFHFRWLKISVGEIGEAA